MGRTVLLQGQPGAGKGVQSRLLKERGWKWIAIGATLRENIVAGTPIGRACESAVAAGRLPDPKLVHDLARAAVRSTSPAVDLVIDGFPRLARQIDELDAMLRSIGRAVDLAIALDVPCWELSRRLSSRRVCPICHESGFPNEIFCRRDGAELVRRPDDTEEARRRRLAQSMLEPIYAKYAKRGVLVRIAADKSVPMVRDAVNAALKHVCH
jgi:adenylate kinase